MAKTIYLLQFNNYFNRTLKGPYGLVDEYTGNGGTIVGRITNMTLWNPNDGVDTVITSNLGLTAIPDYCLVEDGAAVIQRWFVTEAKRLHSQQYQLTLHRDVLADNYDSIINNPDTFVERGWCDNNDPAIYNQEPLTFNQVKQSQTLMYDKTVSPWIVGYIQAPQEDTTIKYETTTGLYQITIPKSIKYANGCPYAIFYMPYTTFSWYKDSTLTNRLLAVNFQELVFYLTCKYFHFVLRSILVMREDIKVDMFQHLTLKSKRIQLLVVQKQLDTWD